MTAPTPIRRADLGHHSDWHDQLDGEMRVAGLPLPQVATLAGRTPFYVYDRGAITARVTQMRSCLPDAVQLHYAIKANPMPAVINHLATLVDGLDVASHGEMIAALASGTPPTAISFAGPGKSTSEVAAAIAAGITLIAESESQINAICDSAELQGLSPRLALRVNPAFELKSSGMRMSGGAKPFGIDSEALPDAIALCRSRGAEPEGLHLFTGSQNLNPAAICEAHNGVTELALQLVDQHGLTPRFINIGGGLGIPYFPGEKPLDLRPIADNLGTLVERIQQHSESSALVMEMGRYLVGEAGLYVCKVLEKKHSRGVTYLVVDGGLHHHLANSGNFGQVIRKNFPVELVGGDRRNPQRVTVVGPLCTPLDIIADKILLADASPGDLVVVRQSGAYGLSASPQNFLSHPAPAELLL